MGTTTTATTTTISQAHRLTAALAGGRAPAGAAGGGATPPTAPKPAAESPAATERRSVADASTAADGLGSKLDDAVKATGHGLPVVPVRPHPGPTLPDLRPHPTAPAAPVTPSPKQQQVVLDAGIALLRTSPTGEALYQATVGQGVEIVISTDADLAHFDNGRGEHGTVVINPNAFTETERITGILGHELGHAYVHSSGTLDRLGRLPDNVGTLANEVIAESIATTISQEAGFVRGASAISRGDGTYRSPAQGFDDILESDFYVDYYKIDLASFTPTERQQAYDVITDASIGLITSLGSTPPANVFEGAQPHFDFASGVTWTWAGQHEADPVHPKPDLTPQHAPMTPEQRKALTEAMAKQLGELHERAASSAAPPARPAPRS
jgi:hypothetical protein